MKPVPTVVLPALLVALLATAAAANDMTRELTRAAKFLQKGDHALEQGNLDEAERQYARALTIADGFPEAHIGMGNVAMQRDRFEEALGHYRQAHDGYAEFADLLATFRRDRYVRAQARITELRDAILVLQHPATSRGDAEFQISQMENRINRLESVLPPALDDVEEPPGEIFFFIGNALFRLDRVDEAIESWLACVKRAPRHALCHNNLAVAYWRAGRPDRAREFLKRAEALGFPVSARFRTDLEAAASLQ